MSNSLNTRKLIFFDIDGTLITEGASVYVPESTQKALDLLRQQGHICMINTGRPFAALDDLILSIRVDGYICGCGTYIRLGDNVLMAKHIDADLGSRIVTAMDLCGIEWLLEGEKALYYADRAHHTYMGKAVDSIRNSMPGRIHAAAADQYDKISFDKFTMVIDEESDLNTFCNMFREELTFIDRGNRFYEVVPRAYSKATGMRFMEEYLGIGHEDTIAVGDSTNDLPMLEYAAFSILMENADPLLRSSADYVTTAVTNDGIWNAFHNLGLI